MNTLAKFKHKPSSHGTPVLSFRFNPGDEDLEEVSDDLCPNNEDAQITNRRDSNESEKSRKSSGAEETLKTDPNGNDSKTIAIKEPSSQLETSLKDSRESSPLKESVREYLAKVGKRSASLDYSLIGNDSEGWLSGIKGKIAKRMEGRADRIKKETNLDPVPEKSPESKPFISHRSQSSCDVRERLDEESGASVEEGLDCTATDDSQVPYTYNLEEKDGSYVAFSPDSSQLTPSRKLSVAAMASGAQALLARKRSKNFSSPITLSSLKATRSFESEILEDNDFDDDTWEHVEVCRSLEEKPEEPMIFQDVPGYDGGEALVQPNEGRKQLWMFLLQPTMRKKLIALVVVFLSIWFAPISGFFSGFLLGTCVSAIVGSFLIWFLKEPKPKEQIMIPNYAALPPLRIPSRDVCKEDSRIFKGWMNALESEDYNADTYHVNSTHSVFVRLDGTYLRLSKPKVNVPKRAMWNEPKYTPVFIGQQHLQITDAQVTLPPDGLAKKRLWSKKYPICLAIKPAQPANRSAAQQGSEDEESSSGSDDATKRRKLLYLFARTSREKEEWFGRFRSAARSALPPDSPGIDYGTYGKWIVSEESITSYVKSVCPTNDPNYGDTTPEHVWLNALVSRILYDFLTKKMWSDVVAERIQRKLSVIKVPYFMEELKLKDINLGSNLPIFHRMSRPVSDARGLWVDFDVTYKGTFQMTLETKLNLMKLKKEQVEALSSVSNLSDSSQSTKSYLCNSDEESSADSSEDEISPSDLADSTSDDGSARAANTSKTVLKWVDKITKSRYFQQATEIRYIKKAMTEFSNTPLVLTVQVHVLVGTLALNVPPPPSDRLWYGFRTNPQLSITARPKLGEHEVTFAHITEWIEKKLSLEFQKLLVMPNMDDLVIPIMESGLRRDEKIPSP